MKSLFLAALFLLSISAYAAYAQAGPARVNSSSSAMTAVEVSKDNHQLDNHHGPTASPHATQH